MVHVHVVMAREEEHLHCMPPSLLGAVCVVATTHHQRMLIGKLSGLVPHAEQLLKPFPFLIVAHFMSLQITDEPLAMCVGLLQLRGKHFYLLVNGHRCLHCPNLDCDPVSLFQLHIRICHSLSGAENGSEKANSG